VALFKLYPFTGVNKDLSKEDLPLGSVTDAENVRFREGYAELFLGQSDVYPTAPIDPISAFPVRIGADRYWIALSQLKAYCVTGSPAVWTDITRATGGDYAATLDDCWNGGILNGVPILNNGVDTPQMWSPVETTQDLQALTAWPTGYTAAVMRPFGNVMFALDINDGTDRFPYRVLWSHPADPGTVPVSWDVTDPTKDAGQFDLAGNGFVIDALTLRQSLVIYAENSTHIANFVGAPFIYDIQQLFSNSGILSKDCVVEVNGSHFVLTSNDFIRHDGSNIQSVLDKQTRRYLFQSIDSESQDRCFVVKNVYFNEVWVCYPELGETSCTKALVYNYKDNSVSFRDLPSVTAGNTGLVDDVYSDTFDGGGPIPFDMDTLPFDQNEFGAQLERTLLCAPDRPALVLMDAGNLDFDEAIQGSMERTGLTFDAPNQIKTVTRVRPRFKAPAGTVLTFQIGSHQTLDGDVTWSPEIVYTVGTDLAVNAFASGYFLAWRILSTDAYQWRLDGMDFEFTPRGSY
jgi:hypothetical protein